MLDWSQCKIFLVLIIRLRESPLCSGCLVEMPADYRTVYNCQRVTDRRTDGFAVAIFLSVPAKAQLTSVQI